MSDAEYELRFMKAGIEQLESYLLSRDVFRPIGIPNKASEPPYPQLTLGWLLLFQLRARAVSQTSKQQSELQRLEAEMEVVRTKWRTAWSNKAAAEFRSRLNLWTNFLEEFETDPTDNLDRFPYEVTRRVQLDLLMEEIFELPKADRDALNGLDVLLNAIFIPGDFVWEPIFKPSFPKARFWYLYGSLRVDQGA